MSTRWQIRSRPTMPALTVLAAITLATAGLNGCYERVISAKGMGADAYQIQPSYQSNSKLDDWLYGPRNKMPASVNP